MSVSVIVPTFNEAPNVRPLVERINAAVLNDASEIVFVDDSTDDTPEIVRQVAEDSRLPIRLIHREVATGGLSGAVAEGLRTVKNEWAVVMDGDLQHPPEMIPVLLTTGQTSHADVVVASRHVKGGSSDGLAGGLRHLVSGTSGVLTKAMFPLRLRNCSDPMTGFFAVRTAAIDLEKLHPRGFKILLELLARQSLTIVEEPFIFGERFAGESKASLLQGIRFVQQLAALRFGRMSRFAMIGASGAVLNLLIMAALLAFNVNYVAAAIVAAVITILTNFFLQEHFVFGDLRDEGKAFRSRFVQAVGFNGSETVVRTYVLYLLVQFTPLPALLAQAITLAVAFLARFVFQSRVVYRPRRTAPSAFSARAEAIADLPTAERLGKTPEP